MHLWPSMRLRDSFKHAYLEKAERNIRRMNSKKKKQQNNQNHRSQSSPTLHDKLLDHTDDKQPGDGDDVAPDSNDRAGGVLASCRELLIIVYCCFCCGACEEEN